MDYLRRREIWMVLVCFAAGLGGANVTPVLTGAGKVVFPEANPSANIGATSGALTMAAGGTNQNIVTTPSGAGNTILGGRVGIGGTPSPANTLDVNGIITVKDGGGRNLPGGIATEVNAFIIDFGLNDDSTSRFGPYNASYQGGMMRFDGRAGAGLFTLFVRAAGGTAVGPAITVLSSGNAGFGTTGPNYRIDAAGDINATGVYRQNGTAGVGGAITAATGTAVASVGCTTSTIQYLDWTSAHQTITVCTGLTVSNGTFVTSIPVNNFAGGIRIQ